MITKDNQYRLNELCDEIELIVERLGFLKDEIRKNNGYTYAIGGAIRGLQDAARDNREAYARYAERMEQRARVRDWAGDIF